MYHSTPSPRTSRLPCEELSGPRSGPSELGHPQVHEIPLQIGKCEQSGRSEDRCARKGPTLKSGAVAGTGRTLALSVSQSKRSEDGDPPRPWLRPNGAYYFGYNCATNSLSLLDSSLAPPYDTSSVRYSFPTRAIMMDVGSKGR
jgi:hypothetical protein